MATSNHSTRLRLPSRGGCSLDWTQRWSPGAKKAEVHKLQRCIQKMFHKKTRFCRICMCILHLCTWGSFALFFVCDRCDLIVSSQLSAPQACHSIPRWPNPVDSSCLTSSTTRQRSSSRCTTTRRHKISKTQLSIDLWICIPDRSPSALPGHSTAEMGKEWK